MEENKINNVEDLDFSEDLLFNLKTYNSQISAIRNNSSQVKSKIRKILGNSIESEQYTETELQRIGEILTSKNGQLRELITYKSNLLTFDHYIMPLDASKYNTEKDIKEARRKASKQVEKYNLKYNCKWITQDIIEYGEIYLALIKSKNNYLFYKFPREMCKITQKTGNMVSKFAINLGYLNSTNYYKYPQEIQDLYWDYQEGRLDKRRIIDSSWYQMTETIYVAFTLEEWQEKGIPYYSYLFDSLASLEELSDLVNLNAYIDSFRLLHQKPELDDRGQLKMERKKILNYHNSLKSLVPYGYCTLTSPLDLKLIASDGNSSSILDAKEKTKTTIYDSSGVNDNLFNGNTTNTEAVSIGFTIDTLLPLRIQKEIENWVNDHMKTVRATSNWFLEFVTTNEYNQGLEAERQRNALTIYSPKWKYLATIGLTPLRALSTIESEELEDIASAMLPLSTAYTQVGNEVGGRPNKAENGESNASNNSTNPNE